MKTNLFSSNAGLDEVVFENRNKTYGAYDLRKTYDERLTLSAMATVSFFMLILSSFFILQPKPDVPAIPDILKDPMEYVITPIEPPVFIEEPERMFAEPAATAEVTPTIVKEEVQEKDKKEPEKEIIPSQGGNGTENGIFGGTGNSAATGTETGGTVIKQETKISTDEFIDFADKAPVFPNYESYLQSHIEYPEYAISNNIQGVIYVMVKINEKGKVVAAEIIKGIGGGCDEEAVRVIKSMPAWEPGIQNGKPVPVKCVLRVKMLLQN